MVIKGNVFFGGDPDAFVASIEQTQRAEQKKQRQNSEQMTQVKDRARDRDVIAMIRGLNKYED